MTIVQARPSFNWMLFFTGEVRRRIDLFTAKELATLAWVCARWVLAPHTWRLPGPPSLQPER